MKTIFIVLTLFLGACASAPVPKTPDRVVAAVEEFHFPKSLSESDEAKLPIDKLEALYLKERCGTDHCSSILQRDPDPKDVLTEAEQIVLQKYTEGNNIENARIMIAGAEKLPQDKIVAFHGGSSGHYGALKTKQMIELTVITSVSTDRTKAEDFIQDELWKIHTRTARNIQGYSVVPEHEFLLLPGARLQVDKVSKVKVDLSSGNRKEIRTVNFIELSEIPN